MVDEPVDELLNVIVEPLVSNNQAEASNEIPTNDDSSEPIATSSNIIKMRFVKDATQPGAKKKTTKKNAKKNIKRRLSTVDSEPSSNKRSRLDIDITTYLRGFLNIVLLNPSSDFVDKVINSKIVLTENHIKPIFNEYVANLPLLYAKLKDLNIFSDYFDTDAQAQIFSLLKSNENLKAVKCNICSLVANQAVYLKCNKCECLFHLKCVKKTYKPKKKAWFCEKCID
jgi:hypothetical protein